MSKPPSTPDTAKAPAPVELPDAALLDGEDGDANAVPKPPTRTGLRRFVPASVLGWVAALSILAVTLGGAAAAALLFTHSSATPASTPSAITGPARVLSGDTLVVAGQTVRLQGIEAPSPSLICFEGSWDYKCGEDALRALEVLIGERPVECEPAPAMNGVVTGRCFSEQDIDLGASMVENGWAVADLHRSSRYVPQHAKAQDENRGLWRNNFAYPEQWRLAARGEIR